MSNEKGKAEDAHEGQLAFDEIELHSDINVHHKKEPPARREVVEKKTSSSGVVWLLLVLFLAAAGAAGYFFNEHRLLKIEVASLADKAAETGANLEETKETLASVASSVDTQKGTLKEAEANIKTMQKDLSSARKENTTLKTRVQELEGTLSERDKELKAKQKELAGANKQKRDVEKKVNGLTAERNKARAELKAAQEAAGLKIAELEEKMNVARKDLADRTDAWSKRERQLIRERDGKVDENQRLQAQFKDEADASRKIIMETGQLRRENDELSSKVREAERTVRDLNDKVKALENVDFGDLVPFSEGLDMGKVRYREPLPDGVKIPRKMGKAVIHVLVNEVGNVEKAILLPDEQMDAALSAALARNIYKWKFTPPSLNGVRVKAWQPVLVYPQ